MTDVGEDPALIGRTIAGKFVVEKFLGGGAMGAVYRAHQTALEKTVAVKVMHREVATDAQFKARFHREAKAASRLDHPSSMRVIDFGEEPDGLLYIAMEYLEGRDLYKVIHEDWPLADARIVDILSQALAAIAVAHDMGVIHRDLKPENIMILRGKDDEGRAADVVKVCDFGIAKIQESEDAPATAPPSTVPGPAPEGKKLTTQGLVVGTPEYMSPEQARGEKLDARSDIYSMGVILYQLLTGRTPFSADTALAIVLKHITEQPIRPKTTYAGVNPALESICLKAMAKAREERFQNAREMRSALRAAVDAGRPTPVDASAPTIGAPLSAPDIGAAATAPTIAALPSPAASAGTPLATAVATAASEKKRSGAVVAVALVAIVAGAAGVYAFARKGGDGTASSPPVPTATASAKHADTSTTSLPPPSASLALRTATPPSKTDPSSPNDVHTAKHATSTANAPAKVPGKPVGADTAAAAPPDPPATTEPPAPPSPPPPSPPPDPAPTVAPAPPPATAQPPPTPPAAAFNPAACRAEQKGIVPHGVSAKDLTMRGTVDAWTACARSSIKEKPPTPIAATIHLAFGDDRSFKGATCAGCPGPLAACVAASTGKTVSLQFKSGDVTGDPSFDVSVTFTCE